MPGSRTDEIRDANVRYHDVAAGDYDRKWGISYAAPAQELVVTKLSKALGHPAGRYRRALEVGAGTGYFSLNLLRAGVIEEAVATDVSPGMLATLRASAARLGVGVETRCCGAEALPFPDASFDLIFGHAVLHHLPDLGASFREFARVLRADGEVAFCGEPSYHGDRLARLPKRSALRLAPAWRRLVRVGERVDAFADDREAGEHGLEHVVDVHAFTPARLESLARDNGFQDVRVSGEELIAGWFGWANRTLESTADAAGIPRLWHLYAYLGYRALKRLDDRLLEPRLPPSIFYNLLLSARRDPAALGPAEAAHVPTAAGRLA